MEKTRLAELGVRRTLTLSERVTSKPFRIVPQVDPAVYDDPDFVLTIRVETVDDSRGGRARGCFSTHTGKPMGKSGRWALGLMAPPAGLKTIITLEATKAFSFGVELEEAEEAAPRSSQLHNSIAFDEFDYAETSSSASTLGVTGVTVDAGDFLVALASVFNSSGSTMAVSDPTNGTWTVPSGSPVLADASSQAHIQYFTNSAALSSATVTFDPTGTSSDIDAVVVEISGAAAAGFDQYVENTGTTSGAGTATVTTGTLTQANNLVLSAMTHSGSASRTLTADANYTLIAEDEDNSSAQALHTQRLTTPTSATTAVTATVAIGAGDGVLMTWAIAAIVVKEAAADGAAALSAAGTGAMTMGGASTATAALSSTGTGAMTMASASIASGAFSMSGEGAMTMVGASFSAAAGDFDMTGAGAMTMVGASLASAALDVQGEGTLTLTSQSIATGAMSSHGEGTLTLEGAATAAGEISISGISTVAWVGASIADGAGDFAMAGVGEAQWTGASLAAGALAADGVSTVDFESSEEEEVEAPEGPGPDIGNGGAWGRESSKRKKRLRTEDEELIKVITTMAPHLLQHRKTLH